MILVFEHTGMIIHTDFDMPMKMMMFRVELISLLWTQKVKKCSGHGYKLSLLFDATQHSLGSRASMAQSVQAEHFLKFDLFKDYLNHHLATDDIKASWPRSTFLTQPMRIMMMTAEPPAAAQPSPPASPTNNTTHTDDNRNHHQSGDPPPSNHDDDHQHTNSQQNTIDFADQQQQEETLTPTRSTTTTMSHDNNDYYQTRPLLRLPLFCRPVAENHFPPPYYNIGAMNVECKHCCALMWSAEASQRHR